MEEDGSVVEGAFLDNQAMMIHREGSFHFSDSAEEYIRIWDGEKMGRLS